VQRWTPVDLLKSSSFSVCTVSYLICQLSHIYDFCKRSNDATLIAGDFVQIRQSMPADLTGKIIVTNTTTAKNVEELRDRGVKILVTTTPRLQGRSFGANVMEATLLALMDKPQSEVRSEDFTDLLDRIPMLPNIEVLN
jgi:hypothetical protein